jgi:hypothetical protein
MHAQQCSSLATPHATGYSTRALHPNLAAAQPIKQKSIRPRETCDELEACMAQLDQAV